LEPGRLAPCIAHDVDGGVGKAELGFIFLQLSRDKLITWEWLQTKLVELRSILIRHDKSDLSTRLPGKKSLSGINDDPMQLRKYLTNYESHYSMRNMAIKIISARAAFNHLTWKHSGFTTFQSFFPLQMTDMSPKSGVNNFLICCYKNIQKFTRQ